jgi:hypothetical protein
LITINKKITKVSLKKNIDQVPDEKVLITDVALPDDAPARMKTLKSENRKWYLTVVYHPGTEQPFALFCQTNSKEKTVQTSDAVERLRALARKKGVLEEHIQKNIDKCQAEPNVSKLTRTISLCLRHGIAIKNIVAELDSMEDIIVGSFLFQIKKFLSQYIKDGEEVESEKCFDCGGTLIFSEGCMMCRDCGSSKCG